MTYYYHVSESYRDLAEQLSTERFDHVETQQLARSKHLHCHALAVGVSEGLVHQGEALGAYLAVERPGDPAKQDNLERRSMYALAPVGHELAVAEHLARAIAVKHGPGRWWSTGGCVGHCGDDGMVPGGDFGGVPYVILRAYYFHDPSCARCSVPLAISEDLSNASIELAAHKDRCFLLGDRVRWNAGMHPGRSWADGKVCGIDLSAGRITMRVTAVSKEWMAAQACPVPGGMCTAPMIEIRHANAPTEADAEAAEAVSRQHERAVAELAGNRIDPARVLGGMASARTAAVAVWAAGEAARREAFAPRALQTGATPEQIAEHIKGIGWDVAWADEPAPDPLDVEHDGYQLRFLLKMSAAARRDNVTASRFVEAMTPAQRAAVSAHWSAELRAKVAASTAADKAREPSVVVEIDDV